ncbi:helix-turn-helix transcriptional regulator [Algiphilus aromaticivorans]|uniref:helix-turn-helix transcriptional regulator n=1 Tax=Algiphilus aromaticivorans TaxID=382454 RepID=UPI0005C233FF|nr:AlpA family transcriptional regulator [Algiphilus aromaticivorans]
MNGDHDSILRLPDVLEQTGLSRSMLYQLMAEERFPRAVRLAQRAVGWRQSDISAWIASRVPATTEAE